MATKVTLRKGTKYQTQDYDTGRLSKTMTLNEDTEVIIGDLGRVYNIYELRDGTVLVVRVENEVR